MAIGIDQILDGVESHAMTLGLFERVGMHEPKNAPGNGLSCWFWAQQIGPVPAASGLAVTTGRLELTGRLATNMLQKPEDAIDPNMIRAVDALMTAYSGDFELGGSVRNVDLLGMHGAPLQARAGYLHMDGRMLRVYDITLPLIVNDLWGQAP